MSPTPDPGSPRALDEINADIRAIWDGRTTPQLTAAERERYHQLLVEYATTHRALGRLTTAA